MRRWLMIALSVMLILTLVPGVLADTDGPAKLPLPYTYAYLTNWEDGVGVFDAPGGKLVRTITTPDTWVSIHGEEAGWVRINNGEWVRRGDLWYAQPSYLRGYVYTGKEQGQLGFVLTNGLNIRAAPGIRANNPPIATLYRYDEVFVQGQETVAGQVWYRIGANQYVLSDYVRLFLPTQRPAEVGADEKWLDVNLAQQTLVAYEGDKPVYATLVASGREGYETARGLNRIWIKLYAGRMSGGNPADPIEYYNLEDVPWTMYFYRDFGVHGAYWHDAFGAVRSHGCVNLSPTDSYWVFNWAGPEIPEGAKWARSSDTNLGTWVYTH